MSIGKKCVVFCRMIKIEHSIFALPFAYAGAFLAARGWPEGKTLLLLTVAMVGVRSFAMGFNRVVDVEYDRNNPRTAQRALVTGEITPWEAWRFCGIMAAIFVLACAAINPVCLWLSPVALVLVAVYSLTKRFTWACHFFLGAVIGLAPVAGWLSVLPELSLPPLLLAFGVLFWIAGFDALYACQDKLYDEKSGLHSLPVSFGIQGSMYIATFCHVNTVIFLFLAGVACEVSVGWYLTLLVSAALLCWEHRLLRPDKLENIRFVFALNGPISVLLLVGTLLGVLV